MKYFACFILGAVSMLLVAATLEADLECHYMRKEKPVRVQETPNLDGTTKRITDEIYVDRIVRVTVDNEVIFATNSIDSGIAKYQTIPVDPVVLPIDPRRTQ